MTLAPRSRKGPWTRILVAAGGLLIAVGALGVTAKPPAAASRAVTLSELRPVSMPDLAPGEEIVLKGTLRTTFDGTVYDAITRSDPGGAPRRGGLFEPERTGFRVASHDPATHEVHLVATGNHGEACASMGLASPCLVPRVAEAAHERLLTEGEFARTLSGGLSAIVPEAPPAAAPPTRVAGAVGLAAGGAALFLALAATLVARRREGIAKVRRAASKALGATKGDRGLASLRAKIDGLVAHADKLESVRKTTADRMGKLDRASLEKKRAVLMQSGAEKDVLSWVDAELAEAIRLERDHDKATFGLERIASALEVISLSSREERGVRVDDAAKDALDEVADELRMREEAQAEAEAEVAPLKARR